MTNPPSKEYKVCLNLGTFLCNSPREQVNGRKNSMIISTSTQVFDGGQHIFKINILTKLGLE